jgi:hypothetical protein
LESERENRIEAIYRGAVERARDLNRILFARVLSVRGNNLQLHALPGQFRQLNRSSALLDVPDQIGIKIGVRLERFPRENLVASRSNRGKREAALAVGLYALKEFGSINKKSPLLKQSRGDLALSSESALTLRGVLELTAATLAARTKRRP